MFFIIIIVKSHKQVLIKTILQDLLKDKIQLSFLWFYLYLLTIFIVYNKENIRSKVYKLKISFKLTTWFKYLLSIYIKCLNAFRLKIRRSYHKNFNKEVMRFRINKKGRS